MKRKSTPKKEFVKCLLGATTAIGVCAGLFSGIANTVMAADVGRAQNVATQYPSKTVAAPADSTPQGYTKASYQILDDELVTSKPTSKDLTREEAAEAGAQMLWEIYGVKLDDARIYMSYNPATETLPRANWCGDVRFGNDRTPKNPGYFFSIDAVTGERLGASFGRILSVDVPLGFDMALEKDPSEYLTLGKDAVKKFGFGLSEIKSASAAGQGYSNNDPSMSVRVTDQNGNTVLLSFSRYDKKLMGVSYPTSVAASDAATKKLMEQVEKEAEKARANSSSNNGSPNLITLP